MLKIKFPMELTYKSGKIHVLCEDGFLHLTQDLMSDRVSIKLLNDILHEIHRQNKLTEGLRY